MPNEGIYRSGKYALWGLAPGCLVLSSLFWIPDDYLALEFNGLGLSFVISILGPLLLVFIPEQLGAQGYIRHYLIRHLLYKENFIPRRYVRFLEYCCRLGYLRRVGGGYSFFHQEFRKYLVEDYKKRFRRQYGSRALEQR
ncbi:MAG: hypothetical protein J5I98_20395 [Phaeodactylibacter sp.]|nr:hypothetical protein [Phaeodactylibacter sp.]